SLDDRGALVEELRDWPARFTDSAMIMEGPMSPPALKRLLSLFELPSVHPPGVVEEGVNPVASRRYFRAVSDLLDELRRMTKPAQVIAEDAKMRDKVWEQVGADTAAVRKAMSAKYKVEF